MTKYTAITVMLLDRLDSHRSASSAWQMQCEGSSLIA